MHNCLIWTVFGDWSVRNFHVDVSLQLTYFMILVWGHSQIWYLLSITHWTTVYLSLLSVPFVGSLFHAYHTTISAGQHNSYMIANARVTHVIHYSVSTSRACMFYFYPDIYESYSMQLFAVCYPINWIFLLLLTRLTFTCTPYIFFRAILNSCHSHFILLTYLTKRWPFPSA